MTTPSTALSEAQKRMVTITTEAGDIVKYGNNPAELAGGGGSFRDGPLLGEAGRVQLAYYA